MKVRAFDKPQLLRVIGRMGRKWRVGGDDFFPESIAEWNLLVILQH